jgi:hypothetical protein
LDAVPNELDIKAKGKGIIKAGNANPIIGKKAAPVAPTKTQNNIVSKVVEQTRPDSGGQGRRGGNKLRERNVKDRPQSIGMPN